MLKRRSTLLAFAFAALLLIIGGASWAIWHRAEEAQREVARLHNAHLQAGNALASIRANVFLGGILVRDYLLDADPSHAVRYSDQFNNIRASTEEKFGVLAASGQSHDEKIALDRLHGEVNNYWDSTRSVLEWTPEQRNSSRAAFLQERLRRREEIVELAGQVEQLMSVNFSRERARITGTDDRLQSSLAWTTGIALLLGLGIAGATVAHIAGLEHRSEASDAELRRLSAQIRDAQEQERRYLSRELHDQAGQMLTGLRMELASISHGAGEEEFAIRVSHAKGIVEQTLRVVRNIAMMLRPSMLDDLGLVSALGWLVRDMKRSSGIEIDAEIHPALDSLPDAESTCVYRMVQEGLTNAVRHSAARRIEVTIEVNAGEVTGSICDNGCGFEATSGKQWSGQRPAGSGPLGIGLIGMEERMQELGGSLRIVSSRGQGARIEFRVPYTKSVESEYAART